MRFPVQHSREYDELRMLRREMAEVGCVLHKEKGRYNTWALYMKPPCRAHKIATGELEEVKAAFVEWRWRNVRRFADN